MPEIAQQPPQPGGRTIVVIIGHDMVFGSDSGARQRVLQSTRLRHRMPASCRDIQPAHIALQIQMDRPWNMTCSIHGFARGRIQQFESAVHDDALRIAKPRLQLRGSDQV